jgi:hypothetical protein
MSWNNDYDLLCDAAAGRNAEYAVFVLRKPSYFLIGWLESIFRAYVDGCWIALEFVLNYVMFGCASEFLRDGDEKCFGELVVRVATSNQNIENPT